MKSTTLPSTDQTTADFIKFRNFLEDACGIVLGENKQYLVTSRLNKILIEHNIASLGELVTKVQSAAGKKLKDVIVEAMTTNETSWFRDNHPYQTLNDLIFPELGKAKRNPIRIWSAACSSGQEPYSISMVHNEFQMKNPGLLTGSLQIVATDISPAVLKQAGSGRYDGLAMARGISPERKQKYFRQVDNEFEVVPNIRTPIQFREMNLLSSFVLLGKFDVIFCRNVLIYFSTELKAEILKKMAAQLNKGGYLFLGGSESLTGISNDFEMMRYHGGVIYKLKD